LRAVPDDMIDEAAENVHVKYALRSGRVVSLPEYNRAIANAHALGAVAGIILTVIVVGIFVAYPLIT
jgi:hypothetical protein